MPSLLDRTHGYAAKAVRRALGKDDRTRIELLERRLAELELALAQRGRDYTGMTINDFGTVITLDHKRRHHLRSDNETVLLRKVPGKPYGLNIEVDVDKVIEIGGLCPDPAFFDRVVTEDGTLTATIGECGSDLPIIGDGCAIEVVKVGGNVVVRPKGGFIQTILVNGQPTCEDDCATFNFASTDCGICVRQVSGGGGNPCVIEWGLNWMVEPATIIGDPVQVKLCNCAGDELYLTGTLVPAT